MRHRLAHSVEGLYPKSGGKEEKEPVMRAFPEFEEKQAGDKIRHGNDAQQHIIHRFSS